MSLFKDKAQDCYRLCVGVTNLTLTKELGFDHMRSMTDEEKTIFMGVLAYIITGIKNASVARKVINYYVSKFPMQNRQHVALQLQDVYAKAREISDETMARNHNGLDALNEIFDTWIELIISILHWPAIPVLKSLLKDYFLDFYQAIYSL